ncbi:hotdog fold thioesterase [Lysobacter sp. A3-1-A15]|uniref:hotdog fold thioesterase n=1 Tax=Novilysobacter viscosus TaxID=3098602 RepID=UPI002ED91F0D
MTDTAATPSPSPSPFRHRPALAELNALSADTAIATLGIVFTELGPDYLRGTMPVDARTHQPYGLLHGGASVLLAETLGSSAGNLSVPEGKLCVGIEINANHVRAARHGTVTGTARPLHVGASTQVWEIRIEDERGRLVCVSRLTLAVVARPPG